MRPHHIHDITLPAIILALCSIFSCKPGKTDDTHTAKTDTIPLRIAILPTSECAAIEQGFANHHWCDTLSFDIKFVHYDALTDIDTAILRQSADIFLADSVRIATAKHIPDSIRQGLKMLIPLPHNIMLITNANKNIRKIPRLKESMVGVPRWCMADTWLTTLLDSASAKASDKESFTTEDVYRAQINSLRVRHKMLSDGLIDAAILPQPWADSLINANHRTLAKSQLKGIGLYTLAETISDPAKATRIETFRKVVQQQSEKKSHATSSGE